MKAGNELEVAPNDCDSFYIALSELQYVQNDGLSGISDEEGRSLKHVTHVCFRKGVCTAGDRRRSASALVSPNISSEYLQEESELV